MEKGPKIENPPKQAPHEPKMETATWENEGGAVYVKKRERKLLRLANEKKERMTKLTLDLTNLDNGEPVESFREEERRIVYFDEEKYKYFIEENEINKYVTLGDMLSDYAWETKYVPDGEMTEPAYRTMAKRILVNEARRDIETIHNREMVTERRLGGGGSTLVALIKLVDRKSKTNEEREETIEQNRGLIAEVALREFLSRTALNHDLNLVVSRVTAEEDAKFKYDFKIRIKRRVRGVAVKARNTNSVGFQLKTDIYLRSPRTKEYGKGRTILVDEIIKLKVPGKPFGEAFKNWLDLGRPSGGPEQFLSRNLKIELLKAVTKGLVEIKDEDIEKMFPT